MRRRCNLMHIHIRKKGGTYVLISDTDVFDLASPDFYFLLAGYLYSEKVREKMESSAGIMASWY